MRRRGRPVVLALTLLGAALLAPPASSQEPPRPQGAAARLEQALEVGDRWLARRLVAAGVDLRGARVEPESAGRLAGRTTLLLHRLAGAGLASGVGFLLESGVDPSVPDSAGDTALHHAARCRTEAGEVVARLVAAGADPAATNAAGNTPLHEAAWSYGSAPGTVAALAAAGADVDARDVDDVTPLHLAVHRRRYPMVAALLEAGANVQASDGTGNTPLHYVAGATPPENAADFESPTAHTSADLARLLLERGARPDVRNRWGTTPLTLANKPWGNPAVVQVLSSGR